jgi:hypothetical protein
MTDLTKLVSWDFKAKSRPNLVHINWAFAHIKLKKSSSKTFHDLYFNIHIVKGILSAFYINFLKI